MAVNTVRGIACKLYVSSVEWKNVLDVEVQRSSDKVNVTSRDNDGYKAERPTLKSGNVSFGMFYDPLSTEYSTLTTAYVAGTSLRVRVEDDQGNTIQDADMYVESCSVKQPRDDVSTVDVALTVKKVYSPV